MITIDEQARDVKGSPYWPHNAHRLRKMIASRTAPNGGKLDCHGRATCAANADLVRLLEGWIETLPDISPPSVQARKDRLDREKSTNSRSRNPQTAAPAVQAPVIDAVVEQATTPILSTGNVISIAIDPAAVQAAVKVAIDAELAKHGDLRPVIKVSTRDRPEVVVKGLVHHQFATVLRRVATGKPVMLVGPSGSGKTHLVEQVAKHLGLNYTFNSMTLGVKESDIMGKNLPDKDGVWTFRYGPFAKTYINGGLHLLDEVDGADPNMLLICNAPLANGKLSIPSSDLPPFDRHAESYFVAAANTYGLGATRQYAGRVALDGATLDRFQMGMVEIDFDRGIEETLVREILDPNLCSRLLTWAWGVRDRINKADKLRRLMSTRVILHAAANIVQGETLKDQEKTYFMTWSRDERARVGQTA